ncbi:hypothetical protein DSL72_004070 [Monilinia vaccinii-corymbosi]|uniref:N-acetylgalactosaminide beta-1,3-galactosyltransferase n=1 Tax=Monilinia vaccinii-corymbosi TaxID=61207 RepID=A0A8A3NV23_9HELO|nr:hypothetical protein DSL72_004070 [Monilinia vaccinii-corymbosi]
MLFIKGTRCLVLISVILIPVILYYCYLRLEVRPRLYKSGPIIPQNDITASAWPADENSKPTKSVENAVYPSISPYPQHSSAPKDTSNLEADISATSSSELSVSPSDILLIVKTGASTAWRRMPIQIITTLSNIPNTVIYSDLQENLSHEFQTVDALSNVSDMLRIHDTAAYGIYQNVQANIYAYREQAQLPGDEPEIPHETAPGWILDRYKFLPMLEHAQKIHPGFKWTVYIEDDTFVFWKNLLRWLATLPSDNEPLYYGAHSGENNETFAQGGSGIVFSRSLMKSIFSGPKIPTLQEYANFTAKACCGDMILGKVLRDHNVLVNQGQYGPISFRPEPPWKTMFEEFNWCKPIFTFHHLHQRDLVQLTMLESKINQRNLGSQRPIIFRDIFVATISPHLMARRKDWDNFASRHKLTEKNSKIVNPPWAPPPDPVVRDTLALEQAYTSPEACLAACLALSTCLIWKHEIDNEKQKSCSLDIVVILGMGLQGKTTWNKKTVHSGWMMERINESLMKNECEVVVPP